jgi:ABC-type amino acid transport/signal transduction systems, periplasmic component/domain
MKKLLKGLLVAVMALTVTACGSSKEDTKETKTLTVGISPDYAPYESLDKNGNIIGFDIDMVKLFEGYLKEEEGVDYKLEFKQMDFDNIVTQIQGDQIDLGISGFTYDEKREVEWSNPYLGSSQVAVLPKDSKITKVSELEGKKLAAQTGATGETAAKDVKGAEVVGMKNVQDIFNGLAAHQFDGAVVDLGVAKNYVNNGEFKMLNESLLDEKNYIIAKKGNTEVIDKINKCIAKFVASEDYKKLCEKYDLSPLEK